MPRTTTIKTIADLAEDQWGLVTRRQIEATGIAWSTLARLADEGVVLERLAYGVYRLRGSPPADHLQLRAAWMQLAPETMVWERKPEQGVVSHRSAASVYGLGDLTAERHEFTLPSRRQSRRADVRLHRRQLARSEWLNLRGLLVTRPARIAADLLVDGEEPDAIAPIVTEALRRATDYPRTVAQAIAPLAARFGLRRNDGIGLLRWLLELAPDPHGGEWLKEAASPVSRHVPAPRQAEDNGRLG